MKIARVTVPRTSITTSDEHVIVQDRLILAGKVRKWKGRLLDTHLAR